jgi:hypothetical protein
VALTAADTLATCKRVEAIKAPAAAH